MPKRTPTMTRSDLPKIDLAGRYLEYTRLREVVQSEERTRRPHVKFKPSETNLRTRIKVHRK
jgi:hypothetical protein